MPSTVLDTCGRRRSPATLSGFHQGRPPRNKGQRYPTDPPTVEEIIAESDLDPARGAILVRRAKGGKRREVGIDRWGMGAAGSLAAASSRAVGRFGGPSFHRLAEAGGASAKVEASPKGSSAALPAEGRKGSSGEAQFPRDAGSSSLGVEMLVGA